MAAEPHSLAEFEALINDETRSIDVPIDANVEDDGKVVLTGQAAVFEQESEIIPQLGPNVREVIKRGAFDKVLKTSPNIGLLHEHNPEALLATTRSGTLQVKANPRALVFRAELDPTDPDTQRVLPKIKRGDLAQMSFNFRPAPGGVTRSYTGDGILRSVHEVSKLTELTLTWIPAYSQTVVRMQRSLDLSEESQTALIDEIRHLGDEPDSESEHDSQETPDAAPAEGGREEQVAADDEVGTGSEPAAPSTDDGADEARAAVAATRNRIERIRLRSYR